LVVGRKSTSYQLPTTNYQLPTIKITIITPSFNQGQYIEETILSVLSQNYPNLEYIIIDGGSTDNTVEIIKKYEKHLTYWVSEPDQGQSHAINKGLKHATGDIFNWLNSDDTLLPNALHTVARNFLEHKPIAVCGYTQAYWEDGKTALNRISNPVDIEATILGRMSQQSLFYDLNLLKSSGNAYVSDSLHYCMDIELWTRFSFAMTKKGRGVPLQSPCHIIDEVLGRLRFHGTSKSMTSLPDFDLDKCNIGINILRLVNAPDKVMKCIERARLPIYFETKMEICHLNSKRLIAYAIELVIDRGSKNFNYNDFWYLYFASLCYHCQGRFRFIMLPIRLLWRRTN
jgi:glycosyltransferase involved in cell wall biosynthesis